MSDKLTTSIVTVLLALIGVAIVAVLLSGKAQTGPLLTTGGDVFSKILGTSLSPIFAT